MIDWFSLAANALWIIGLAIVLSVFSYASWQASQNHEKLRVQLARQQYQIFFDLAAVLFCLGMSGTSRSVWERILWGILAALFAAQALASRFFRKA